MHSSLLQRTSCVCTASWRRLYAATVLPIYHCMGLSYHTYRRGQNRAEYARSKWEAGDASGASVVSEAGQSGESPHRSMDPRYRDGLQDQRCLEVAALEVPLDRRFS